MTSPCDVRGQQPTYQRCRWDTYLKRTALFSGTLYIGVFIFFTFVDPVGSNHNRVVDYSIAKSVPSV